MRDFIDTHARVIAVALMALIAVVSIVTLIRGETTRTTVAHISADFTAPCSKDSRSQACIQAQVKGAQQIPQRVVCIIVRRAGYPCRAGFVSMTIATASKRRHACRWYRRHHRRIPVRCRHHHRRRHCVINIVGIRVCTPKASPPTTSPIKLRVQTAEAAAGRLLAADNFKEE